MTVLASGALLAALVASGEQAIVAPGPAVPVAAALAADQPAATAPAGPDDGFRPVIVVPTFAPGSNVPIYPDGMPNGVMPATAPAAAPTAEDHAASPGGDIVVSARVPTKADPLLKINEQTYAVMQAVDKAVVGPTADFYSRTVPKPIRNGLRNVLRNLDEPVSAINYVLQLKPGRALKSIARFAINSTLGVAGLFDMARRKPFKLPYKPNSFANTFACYGIGPGPYFFLPIVGSTTLRDLLGLGLDRATLPKLVGKPFSDPKVALVMGATDALTDRVEVDGQLKRLREESADPYVAARDLYLKQRRAEIGAICPKHGDANPDPTLPPRVGKGER